MRCIFSTDDYDVGMQSDIEWVWNYLKIRDKNTISVIKNSLGEFIIRLDVSEDRIHTLKARTMENITIEAQILKKSKGGKHNTYVRHMLKSSNVWNWSPKIGEKKGAKAVFEKIIAESIPRMSRSSINLKRNHI